MLFALFFGSLLIPLFSILCGRAIKGSLLAVAVHVAILAILYRLDGPEDWGDDVITPALLLNIAFFFIYLVVFTSPRFIQTGNPDE